MSCHQDHGNSLAAKSSAVFADFCLGTASSLRLPTLWSRWQCRLKRQIFLFSAADRNSCFPMSPFILTQGNNMQQLWGSCLDETSTHAEKQGFVDSKLFCSFQRQLCELCFSEWDTAVWDIAQPLFFSVLSGGPVSWRGQRMPQCSDSASTHNVYC